MNSLKIVENGMAFMWLSITDRHTDKQADRGGRESSISEKAPSSGTVLALKKLSNEDRS